MVKLFFVEVIFYKGHTTLYTAGSQTLKYKIRNKKFFMILFDLMEQILNHIPQRKHWSPIGKRWFLTNNKETILF